MFFGFHSVLCKLLNHSISNQLNKYMWLWSFPAFYLNGTIDISPGPFDLPCVDFVWRFLELTKLSLNSWLPVALPDLTLLFLLSFPSPPRQYESEELEKNVYQDYDSDSDVADELKQDFVDEQTGDIPNKRSVYKWHLPAKSSPISTDKHCGVTHLLSLK